MEADLVGTVDSLQLPKEHGLWPVFEAIHNAYDAIEERSDEFSPVIRVSITRKAVQTVMKGTGFPEMTGAVIEDNGVGLTQENWAAFNKLYTVPAQPDRGVGAVPEPRSLRRSSSNDRVPRDRRSRSVSGGNGAV